MSPIIAVPAGGESRDEQRGREYTQAGSTSEAVWQALSAFRDSVKGRHLQALEQAHGIWADDPQIEEAFSLSNYRTSPPLGGA